MRHVVRGRRTDGLIELRPRDQRLERPDWYFAAFTVILLATGLFMSAAIPPALLAAVLAAALSGEVCLSLRDLLLLRRPRAEIFVLARGRH
jgi:hypothetical protein